MNPASLLTSLVLAISVVACGGEGASDDPASTAVTQTTNATSALATSPDPTTTPTTNPAPAPATPAPVANDPRLDAELLAASARGDAAAVQSLLRRGASPRAADARGRTALIEAAYAGHLETARVLIAAGADVNTKDNTVQSAFLIATSEIGDSQNAVDLLKLTLANGADVHSLDSFNGTGLIRAADRGFVEIVRVLLQTSMDKDHVNRLGWTALLEAVILGRGDAKHIEVVRLLVAAGVDVNIADRDGVTALQHARRRGYGEMVVLLEAAGGR